MASPRASIPLLRTLLSLLLTGLFLVGGTAGYCLTRIEMNSQAVGSKQTDRIEKLSRQAAAEAAIVHAHSLKLPLLFCFLLGRLTLPVEKKAVRLYGCPESTGNYLVCILRNFIVKNAP